MKRFEVFLAELLNPVISGGSLSRRSRRTVTPHGEFYRPLFLLSRNGTRGPSPRAGLFSGDESGEQVRDLTQRSSRGLRSATG